jgi:hypothetical protein
MAIIISKSGANAPKKIERSTFEQEDLLQELIYKFPETIPLDDMKDKKNVRLLVLAREFPSGSGRERIDALGVDREGDLYLIETKLDKNADKRQVVAQVLDYGASLWGSGDFDGFLAEIDKEVKRTFQVPLTEKLKAFFDIEDDEAIALVNAARKNFDRGAFRFVVLMNRLDGLKNLVLFINRNSEFVIFAVEVEYYEDEEHGIVIPRLFGDGDIERRKGEGRLGPAMKNILDLLQDGQPHAIEELNRLCTTPEFKIKRLRDLGYDVQLSNGGYQLVPKGDQK